MIQRFLVSLQQNMRDKLINIKDEATGLRETDDEGHPVETENAAATDERRETRL